MVSIATKNATTGGTDQVTATVKWRTIDIDHGYTRDLFGRRKF